LLTTTFFLFFLILLLPLYSNLFPYTTLFRSPGTYFLVYMLSQKAVQKKAYRSESTEKKLLLQSIQDQKARTKKPPCLTRIKFRLDRKSTRLNSSHVSISYAVFFLKKKKIT